jgi:sulfoxide reductase heme-binding subunit YedZ
MLKLPRSRWITHILAALFTAAICVLTFALKPDLRSAHALTIGTGYAALILVTLTLIIGTVQMWREKRNRNPVNLYARRDTGIWAGLAGIAHVVLGFQVHLGGVILRYFVDDSGNVRTDLFGASNYTGLIAVLILILLLVLSNDLSMRVLKGSRWKLLQRFNYGLFAFTLIHTFGYQIVVRREPILTAFTIALALIVLVTQGIGIRLYKSRLL